jgi:hypothetical protein
MKKIEIKLSKKVYTACDKLDTCCNCGSHISKRNGFMLLPEPLLVDEILKISILCYDCGASYKESLNTLWKPTPTKEGK